MRLFFYNLDSMYDKIKKFAQLNKMFDGCDNVIVGLSGGADSVCLCLILKELAGDFGFGISAVHVNHGIRGAEADRDEEFCSSFAERLKIPFKAVKVNVPQYAEEHGLGEEEAGRILRYEIFHREAGMLPNSRIAVAHHMNDQAETVIFNMARGSSLKGIGGMQPVSGNVVRPLLCVTRNEIEDFLTAGGWTYCTDSTNLSTQYTRNSIRNELIPKLCAVNSRSVEHIATMARDVREAENFLDELTDREYGRVCRETEDGILICEPESVDIFLLKRIVRRAVVNLGVGLKDVGHVNIENACLAAGGRTGSVYEICKGVESRRTQDGIFICRGGKKQNRVDAPVTVPGVVNVPGGTLEFQLVDWTDDRKISKEVYTKCFDYDKIKSALHVRNRAQGDYFAMDDGHHKKLKSYFIDERVPERMRDEYLLLAEGSHILWIIGRRISSKYKITGDTRRALVVTYTGDTNGES